jgi:hypothetical protein
MMFRASPLETRFSLTGQQGECTARGANQPRVARCRERGPGSNSSGWRERAYMMLPCRLPQRRWTRARDDLGAFLDPELDAPLDHEAYKIAWTWACLK